MRPGQLTPENRPHPHDLPGRLIRFNEAGAINPGKLVGEHRRPILIPEASMRPGQLTPENRARRSEPPGCSTSASMRPGQLTPENLVGGRSHADDVGASMRPGQLTPENLGTL